MGKKGTSEEIDDIDAILAGLDMDDVDTLDDDSGDERKPYIKVAKDIKKGFLSSYTADPKEKIVKFVDNAIPRGIAEEYNFAKGTYNDVREVYDKNINEIKGNVKSVVDLIKEKVGEDSKIHGLLNKVSEKLTTDSGPNYRYNAPTEDEIIANTLNELFVKERKIDNLKDKNKDILENNKFEKNVELNNRMLGNLETISFFHKEYTLNYYKKSIELKLKTLFVNKELLEVTRTSNETLIKQIEAIVKNTALPDLVKYKGMEQLGETMEARFRDNMTDMFFSAAKPLEVMKKNIIKKVSGTVENVKNGLEMGVMTGETAGAMDGGAFSKSEMAGGFAADKLSSTIAEYTSRKLEELPAIRHILKSVKLGMADPTSTFYDLSDKELDKNTVTSRFLSKLFRGIGSLSQTEEVENIRVRENDPDQETMFDYRTKNSIVKIIPMLLGKIYGEVKGLRTGGEPDGIYYDYTTGKLEDNANLKVRLTKNINNALSGVAGSNLERFISLLDENNELDEETKKNIKATLLGHLSKGGSISPKSLESEEFTDKLDEKDRDIFKSKYEQLMGRMNDDVRLVDDVKDALYNIKTNTPFIDKLVQEYYKNGQIDQIDKMGLVDFNEVTGAYSVNNDAYRDLLTKIVKDDSFSARPEEKVEEPEEQSMVDKFKGMYKDNFTTDNTKEVKETKEVKVKPDLKDDLTKVKDDIVTKSKEVSDSVISKVKETVSKIDTTAIANTVTDSIKNTNIQDNIVNNPNIQKSISLLSNITKDNPKLPALGNYVPNFKMVEDDSYKPNFKMVEPNEIESTETKKESVKDTIKNSYGMVNGLSFSSIMDKNFTKTDTDKEQVLLEDKSSKLAQVLKLERVDANTMYDAYKESKEFLNGIDFMSWAKGIGYKNNNGEFFKLPEDERISKLKNQVVSYLENHVKNISGSDIKGKFAGLKKLFDIEPGMTPLQILHKVLTKTREWDRKIMKSIPKAIGTLFKGAFNITKNLFKGGTGILFGGGTMNLLRVLAGKPPVYKDNKNQEVTEQPEYNNEDKENLEKNVEKSSIFTFLKNKVMGKDKSSNKETTKEPEKKGIFGDQDGDGDRDGSWKDRFGNTNKKEDKEGKPVTVEDSSKDKKTNKLFEFLGFFKDKLFMIPKLLGGLLTGMGALKFLPKILTGLLSLKGITGGLGKGIGFIGAALGKFVLSVGKVAGVLMGGKVAEYVLNKEKTKLDVDKDKKVDVDKDKVNADKTKPVDGKDKVDEKDVKKDTKTDIDKDKKVDKKIDKVKTTTTPKGKVGKPKGTKILDTLKSFKDRIIAKLGKKASVGVLARLTAKVGARLIPFAGAALLAYDASMIVIDMIKNDTTLESAISKQVLGFDLFNDDEPVLDEEGNPIKPDEDLNYDKANDAMTQVYTEEVIALNKKETKNGVKDETARAKLEVMKNDYKLKDEEIAKKYNELMAKENEEYNNSATTAATDLEKANKDTTEKVNSAIANSNYETMNNPNYTPIQGVTGGAIASSIFGETVAKSNGATSMVNQWSNNSGGPSIGSGSTLAGQLDLTKGSFDPVKGKEAIDALLNDVSSKTGVDANTLKVFAAIESGMNPNAKAPTSSAYGLFQFIKSTWNTMLNKYGGKYGLNSNASPFDPTANALMGAEYIKENTKAISPVKKDVNTTDLYLAHFLGAGGARQFLSSPQSANAAQMMPKAASANHNIFFTKNGQARSIREVYELMQQKVSKSAKGFGFKAAVADLPKDNMSTGASTPPSVVDAQVPADTKPVENKNQHVTDNTGNQITPTYGDTSTTSTNTATSTTPTVSNTETVSTVPETIAPNAVYKPTDTATVQTVATENTSKPTYSSTDMANGFMVNKMTTQAPQTHSPQVTPNVVTNASNSVMDMKSTNDILSQSVTIQSETMGYIKAIAEVIVKNATDTKNIDKSPLTVKNTKGVNKTDLEMPDSVIDLSKKRYG